MKKNGFTLLELIAVLFVMAILLSILIPKASNIIMTAKINAFKINAEGIISTINVKKMKNATYNPTFLVTENMKNYINIPANDYAGLSVYLVDSIPNIKVVGARKWDGLIACGSENNLIVSTTFDDCDAVDPTKDNLAPNVAFSPDGGLAYKKIYSTTVIVTDNLQVKQNSLIYQWTNSLVVPSKDSFVKKFINASNISSPVNLNGNYYLWVYAEDALGNYAITRSKAFALDNTVPVIAVSGTNPINIISGSIYSDAGATAIDNSDGNITPSISVTSNVDTSAIGSYTVTYNVSDTAGNVAVPVTRTVKVLDVEAPTVAFGPNGNSTYAKTRSTTCTVSDNITVNTSSLKYQWTATTTAPTEASFSTTFTIGGIISSPAGVSGGYYLWILAKDTSNNTAILRSNAFNLDNTAPVISVVGSNPASIDLANAYTDAGATASDNVDGNISSSIGKTDNINVNKAGSYTVTYSVSDACGNNASKTRTLNVNALTQYCYSDSHVEKQNSTCASTCYGSYGASSSQSRSYGADASPSCPTNYVYSSGDGKCHYRYNSDTCNPSWSCGSGYTRDGNSCYKMVTTYSCPSGGSLSGTTCNYTYGCNVACVVDVTVWSSYSAWQLTPVAASGTRDVKTRSCTSWPCSTT